MDISRGRGERDPRPLEACRKAGVWSDDGAVRGQSSASLQAFRCQVGDDPEPALSAQRAGIAVERHGALGLGGCLRRRLRDVDRRTDLGAARGAAAVGEKAAVADA